MPSVPMPSLPQDDFSCVAANFIEMLCLLNLSNCGIYVSSILSGLLSSLFIILLSTAEKISNCFLYVLLQENWKL